MNDCVTTSKSDNVHGCRHSLPDGTMRATDVMIGGKRARMHGYGAVDNKRGPRSRSAVPVLVRCFQRSTQISALQACMEGFQVPTMEACVDEVVIFVNAVATRFSQSGNGPGTSKCWALQMARRSSQSLVMRQVQLCLLWI